MAIWNQPDGYEQLFEITTDTTVFNLDTSYAPGTRELSVWLNGLPAIRGRDYIEVNSLTIQFNYTVKAGDTVLCRITKQG